MRFGKFEISQQTIIAIVLVLMLFLVLHYTIEEVRIKEETKQLELQKEIILLEKKEGE